MSGATCHEAPSSTAKANESRSYRDELTAGQDPVKVNNPGGVRMTSTKILVHQAGVCDDSFTADKKTRNKLVYNTNVPIHIYIKAGQLCGVRNSCNLPVIYTGEVRK
jgi:hypothetical protein